MHTQRMIGSRNMHVTQDFSGSEPVGAGNGGLAGSFVSVVFSIVIGSRAVPDLYRWAPPRHER
jgi:hypothetical protein